MGHTLDATTMGRVMVATFNRPDQLNTMNAEMLDELDALLRQIAADRSLGALVITGSGRAFCAGGDINGFEPDLAAEAFAASAKHTTDVLDHLQGSSIPTIAAINGIALGGGLELALACDLRVAVSAAKLGTPEIALGFLPGGGGTARLSRMVPPAIAKQLLLTGQPITAAEAYRVGLINDITDDAESCLSRALTMAERLASMPPLAVAAGKWLVDKGALLPLDEAIVMERQTVATLFATRDRVEGVAAFMERRSPRFEGR
jgi:enoyl-CoA hydratase